MENEKVSIKTNKDVVTTFRLLQAICWGIFILGLAMIVSDLGGYYKSPISAMSLTTTTFGLLGGLLSGSMAKSAKTW